MIFPADLSGIKKGRVLKCPKAAQFPLPSLTGTAKNHRGLPNRCGVTGSTDSPLIKIIA